MFEQRAATPVNENTRHIDQRVHARQLMSLFTDSRFSLSRLVRTRLQNGLSAGHYPYIAGHVDQLARPRMQKRNYKQSATR